MKIFSILIIFLLGVFILIPVKSLFADDSLTAEIQYEMGNDRVETSRIDIDKLDKEQKTLAIVVPFKLKQLVDIEPKNFYSISPISNGTVILVFLDDNCPSHLRISASLDTDTDLRNPKLLRTMNYPSYSALIVPEIPTNIPELNQIMKRNIRIMNTYQLVSIRFREQYQINEIGKDPFIVTKDSILPLKYNSGNKQYELIFENIHSGYKGILLSIVRSLIPQLTSIILAIIALGYIPNRKFKIVVFFYTVATIALMVVSIIFMGSKAEMLSAIPSYLVFVVSMIIWWFYIRPMRDADKGKEKAINGIFKG